MSGDMPFAEGCYRLEGHDWQVVTAIKARGAHPIGISVGVTWPSGVTGMSIVLPDHCALNASGLLNTMSDHLGVTLWREVRGPDSMQLR